MRLKARREPANSVTKFYACKNVHACTVVPINVRVHTDRFLQPGPKFAAIIGPPGPNFAPDRIFRDRPINCYVTSSVGTSTAYQRNNIANQSVEICKQTRTRGGLRQLQGCEGLARETTTPACSTLLISCHKDRRMIRLRRSTI